MDDVDYGVSFTFHYVSIKSDYSWTESILTLIYIPICIY